MTDNDYYDDVDNVDDDDDDDDDNDVACFIQETKRLECVINNSSMFKYRR